MQLPDSLFALFSAEIEERNGNPVVVVPERELRVGDLAVGDTYRIAILPRTADGAEPSAGESRGDATPGSVAGGSGPGARSGGHAGEEAGPPVEVGELHEVEIEDIGDQGDGIARIGPGYIVFVPGSDVGDRVTVEITQARENFAFADVVEDEPISG